MCSPVERCVCFCLVSFLYNIEDVPKKKWASALSCVLGKVVYLHDVTVYCVFLFVSLLGSLPLVSFET